MSIKKVDNRNRYCTEYWHHLKLQQYTSDVDFDLAEVHQKIDKRIVCTFNKKFVYGFETPEKSHIAVIKHNNALTKIKQKSAMTLNWLVKHYNLRHIYQLKVGINYNLNDNNKYIISFKEHKKESIQFIFNHVKELEIKVKQYYFQQKLYNLLSLKN